MFRQITTQIYHRSLNTLHILLQLSHITLNTIKPSNLLLNITDRLKHSLILVNNLLHKHTQMVNVCITHTHSLTLFQWNGKRHQTGNYPSSVTVRDSRINLSKSSRLTKYALPGLYAGNFLDRIHALIVSSGTLLSSSS